MKTFTSLLLAALLNASATVYLFAAQESPVPLLVVNATDFAALSSSPVGGGLLLNGRGDPYLIGSNPTTLVSTPATRLPLAGQWVELDGTGSFYLCGETNTTVSADGLSWVLNGRFLAKFNPARRLLWAVNLPNDAAGNSPARCVVIPSGGAVTLGQVRAVANLKSFDGEGEPLWSQRLTNLTAHALAVDRAGATLVAGVFTNTILLGTTTLTSLGNSDVAICKVDSAGNVLWARQIGGTLAESVSAVAIGADDSVLVSGTFTRRAASEGVNIQAFGGAGRDVFVASYSAAGALNWLKPFGDFGDDQAIELSSDDDGNGYLAYVHATGDAAQQQITKLDSLGVVLWERRITDFNGAPGGFEIRRVAADRSGNVLVGGRATSGRVYRTVGNSTVFLSNGDGGVFRLPTTNPDRDDQSPVTISTYAGLSIAGRLARTYRVEFRPRLAPETAWQTITNVNLAYTPFLWVDPTSSHRGQGYFRVTLVP